MHPNPAYRSTSTDETLAFAREQGFGMLIANGDGTPLVSHNPFILNENGDLAEFHLVRSNPLVRTLKTGTPVRIAVQGIWKLNQTRPDTARPNAADHMDGAGLRQEPRLLAALMRGASDG